MRQLFALFAFALVLLIPAVLPSQAAMNIPGILEVDGTFTPTDQSGAGITFTSKAGFYHKKGKDVHIWGYAQFPSTASAVQINLGPLPFTSSASGINLQPSIGMFGCAVVITGLVNINSTALVAGNGAGAVNNVSCSSGVLYFSGEYTTDQ